MAQYYQELIAGRKEEADQYIKKLQLDMVALRVKDAIAKDGLETVLAKIIIETKNVWVV